MPTGSLIMNGQHLKRFALQLMVALFCYHVAIALAEQRSGGGGDTTNNHLRESGGFGGSSLLKSALMIRQKVANDQQQQQQQQQQAANEEPMDDQSAQYTMRYIIKDVDQDSNSNNYRQIDQWEMAKLGELLEALSMSLPPPASEQVHRSGRTYLFGGSDRRQVTTASSLESPAYIQSAATYNRYAAQQPSPPRRPTQVATGNKQQQQPTFAELAEQKQRQLDEGSPSSLGSALWPQATRTMSIGPLLSGNRATNARRSHTNPHHTSDTAEVAIHTPLHSRSVSDYEWKRVENSRWNNLRGMWGKRSVPLDMGADGEDSSNDDAKRTPANLSDEHQQNLKSSSSPDAHSKPQPTVGNSM